MDGCTVLHHHVLILDWKVGWYMKLRQMRKLFYITWFKAGRLVDGVFVPEHVFYRYYKQYIKPNGRK